MILVLVTVLVMAKSPRSIFPWLVLAVCSWCTAQLGLALGHGTTSALSSLPRPPHTRPSHQGRTQGAWPGQ